MEMKIKNTPAIFLKHKKFYFINYCNNSIKKFQSESTVMANSLYLRLEKIIYIKTQKQAPQL
jgi:hypothetical protein